MKVRNGFVSNSSSSSFVVFGYGYSTHAEFKKNFSNEQELDNFYNSLPDDICYHSDVSGELCILGNQISRSFGDDVPFSEASLIDLNKKAKELHKFMDELNIPYDEKDLKVFTYTIYD